MTAMPETIRFQDFQQASHPAVVEVSYNDMAPTATKGADGKNT